MARVALVVRPSSPMSCGRRVPPTLALHFFTCMTILPVLLLATTSAPMSREPGVTIVLYPFFFKEGRYQLFKTVGIKALKPVCYVRLGYVVIVGRAPQYRARFGIWCLFFTLQPFQQSLVTMIDLARTVAVCCYIYRKVLPDFGKHAIIIPYRYTLNTLHELFICPDLLYGAIRYD